MKKYPSLARLAKSWLITLNTVCANVLVSSVSSFNLSRILFWFSRDVSFESFGDIMDNNNVFNRYEVVEELKKICKRNKIRFREIKSGNGISMQIDYYRFEWK